MRRILVLSATALALVITVSTPAQEGATSRETDEVRQVLEVEAETIDLGRVPSGRTLEATFVLRNTGEQPIEIIRAKPT